MTPSQTDDARALNRAGMAAMAQRQPQQAEALLRQALQQDPSLLSAWLNLAALYRHQGDLPAAMAAVTAARRVDPLCFPALLMRGSLYEAMGQQRKAALGYHIALTQMLPEDVTDAATRRAIEHATAFCAAHQRDLEAHLRQALADLTLSGAGAVAQRMNGFIDHMVGKRRHDPDEAINFFYPGLPRIEVFDRRYFPWIAELEQATGQIQEELAAVFDDEAANGDIEPYTQLPDGEPLQQWRELNRSARWSAYHFANHGQHYPQHRQKCPNTAALLDRIGQPQVQHRSPAAFFSILAPQTHIPPHRGVANFRLLCHLPLILPPGCRLRVGGTLQHWRMGEAFVFDDSIEHEAWNDSDQPRTVLIFDVWNPLLEDEERQLVSRAIAALDDFNAMDD